MTEAIPEKGSESQKERLRRVEERVNQWIATQLEERDKKELREKIEAREEDAKKREEALLEDSFAEKAGDIAKLESASRKAARYEADAKRAKELEGAASIVPLSRARVADLVKRTRGDIEKEVAGIKAYLWNDQQTDCAPFIGALVDSSYLITRYMACCPA